MEKPWINNVLIKQLKIKDELGKLAAGNIKDFNIFKKFRNVATSNIRKAKEKYISQEILNYNASPCCYKRYDSANFNKTLR